MTVKVYHKDIGFPNLPMRDTLITLTYSKHALREADNDRYGKIKLPRQVMLKRENLIEIQMNGPKVVCLVTRQPYSKEHDLVIVLNTGDNFVRTVWLNRVDDLHETLDESKYTKP